MLLFLLFPCLLRFLFLPLTRLSPLFLPLLFFPFLLLSPLSPSPKFSSLPSWDDVAARTPLRTLHLSHQQTTIRATSHVCFSLSLSLRLLFSYTFLSSLSFSSLVPFAFPSSALPSLLCLCFSHALTILCSHTQWLTGTLPQSQHSQNWKFWTDTRAQFGP